MKTIIKIFHLKGIWRFVAVFLINKIFVGTNPKFFNIKRKLLISIGHSVGEGTKIVGPIECTGKLIIGKDCWIGKNLKVNGNGCVTIGDCCDIAPEVTFQTGGHNIGDKDRRAGEGLVFYQTVGNGVWIGGRVTILGNAAIGDSCVIAGCACVTKDVEPNMVVGGVPAKIIRSLEDDT